MRCCEGFRSHSNILKYPIHLDKGGPFYKNKMTYQLLHVPKNCRNHPPKKNIATPWQNTFDRFHPRWSGGQGGNPLAMVLQVLESWFTRGTRNLWLCTYTCYTCLSLCIMCINKYMRYIMIHIFVHLCVQQIGIWMQLDVNRNFYIYAYHLCIYMYILCFYMYVLYEAPPKIIKNLLHKLRSDRFDS